MSPEMISVLSVGIALAALIRGGQARMDKRLDNFEKRVDARFREMDTRFREMDTRLGTLEQRMSRVEGLLEGLGVTGRVGTTVG